MAKLSLINREAKRERMVNKFAAKRAGLVAIFTDIKLSEEERMVARLKFQQLPRNSSPSRQRNRCALTGRGRGYIRHFGISRIQFRDMALNGLIPGVRKASW